MTELKIGHLKLEALIISNACKDIELWDKFIQKSYPDKINNFIVQCWDEDKCK